MLSFKRFWGGSKGLVNWCLVAVVGAASLLAGCNSATVQPAAAVDTAAPPSWVTQPPSRPGYAYGSGSAEVYGSQGQALERAQELAKADLLASLRVEISSSTEYSKSASMEFEGEFSLQENLNQQIRSSTPPIELSGIQISATWVNPAASEVWALAELNTSLAAERLLARLHQLEAGLVQRGTWPPRQPEASKLARVRYLKPSLQELVERQQLRQQLDFLGAATQATTQQSQAIEQISLEVAQLLASLGIQLQASSSQAEALVPILASSLTGLGFNLVNQQADLQLRLNLQLSQLERNGLFYVDAKADGQIIDAQQRTLHALHTSTRSVSSAASVAHNKATTEVAQQLAQDLIASLYLNL